MFKATVIGAAIVLGAMPNDARAEPASRALAKTLLEGCLAEPKEEFVAALAKRLNAAPHSAERRDKNLGRERAAVYPDPSRPGEAQHTRISTTAVNGWDLPGIDEGSLEYFE